MRPTEVTPLLRSTRETYTDFGSDDLACNKHDETRQVLQQPDGELHKVDEHIVLVSEPISESSPPGCSLALFLVLLFSLFISNIEGSLLLATHTLVASDFGQFNQSQWLIVAYPLAASAAEPVIGSVSNGMGRKPLLLMSYIVFASAASLCGAAPHFTVLIIGRVLAGIGGSGMIAMVNLVVSDLVGLENLATYRSFFQAAMATGRLLGGPVGGFLAERLGWRLVFIAQTPILLLAALLCAILMPSVPAPASGKPSDRSLATKNRQHKIWMTLRQVDFCGALLLVCTITLGLVSIVLLGDGHSIHDIRVSLGFGLCLACGALLFIVESYLISRPMLSRRLLCNPVVVGIYLINFLGMTAQSSLTFILPLEDIILNSAKSDQAGLQLLPLVFGSITGSMAAGRLIKKNYNMNKLFATAMIITSLARAAMYLEWYSMDPILRRLPLIVIGVSSSVTFATTFIFLNAQVSKTDQAMAVTSLFCLYGIGSAIGTTSSKVIINSILRSRLTDRLDSHDPNTPKIIASLMEDHHLMHKIPQSVRATVQQCIRDSFSASRVSCVFYITHHIGPCYLAVMLICIGQYPNRPAGSAWLSSNVGGDTKRAIGIALNICIGNTGGVLGAYIFLSSEAPDYPTGNRIGLGLVAAAMLCVIGLELSYSRINKKRSALSEVEVRPLYNDEQLARLGDKSPLFGYKC